MKKEQIDKLIAFYEKYEKDSNKNSIKIKG